VGDGDGEKGDDGDGDGEADGKVMAAVRSSDGAAAAVLFGRNTGGRAGDSSGGTTSRGLRQ
jgi:hypothetical protein